MFASMLPMWLGGLLVWGALIGVAVWATRRFTGPTRADAARILEERFARGEIDAEEFNDAVSSWRRRDEAGSRPDRSWGGVPDVRYGLQQRTIAGQVRWHQRANSWRLGAGLLARLGPGGHHLPRPVPGEQAGAPVIQHGPRLSAVHAAGS